MASNLYTPIVSFLFFTFTFAASETMIILLKG